MLMLTDPGSPEGLHIITPPTLIPAKPVENWQDIIPEALDILQGIRNKGFIFPNSDYTDCFAIAQPQVSPNPLQYFVLNDGDNFDRVTKQFGGLVVINPVLIGKLRASRVWFKDACMSYPYSKPVKLKRYHEVRVSYDTIKHVEGGFLTSPKLEQVREKQLTGEAALVFLHELEHLRGQSIYAQA